MHRKEFLKIKAAAKTFAVKDLFTNNRIGQVYKTDNLYQDSSRRNVRNFLLRFTYRLGNSDFKLLGNTNRKSRDMDDEE